MHFAKIGFEYWRLFFLAAHAEGTGKEKMERDTLTRMKGP